MYDGDLVMLTDNEVLLRNHVDLPTLMCAQRKAEKKVPTREDFIQSNIDSFGNSIGQTTNWITSMFEVRSHFEPDSKEYKELSYRIMCGQLYQQNPWKQGVFVHSDVIAKRLIELLETHKANHTTT